MKRHMMWYFIWFRCLFDLILYVPSTIFQLYRDGSSWIEPVLGWDKCVLLKDHNAVTSVRLEPAAIRSRVKHSTTEPLRSLYFIWLFTLCRRTHWLVTSMQRVEFPWHYNADCSFAVTCLKGSSKTKQA